MRDANTAGGPRALILLSLLDGPKHGYAIIEDVAAISDVTLGPGTLYGAITALEQAGLIAPLAPEGRRRPYELTGAGRAVAAEQEEAWRGLADAAARKRRARTAQPARTRGGAGRRAALGGAP